MLSSRAFEWRSEYGYLMVDLIWPKTKEGLFFSPLMMRERTWLSVFFLIVLFACELFLPGKGQAQFINETGEFYFTGIHLPFYRPMFREFMSGEGFGHTVKVGPVRLRPHVGVAEVFTDNVNKLSGNRNSNGEIDKRESDFLTSIAPGLQALLPFGGGKHSLLLDYRANQLLYNKTTSNNVLTQDAQGHMSLKFPGGLSVDLQGGHIEGYDPRGTTFDTGQRDITKWNANSVLGQIEYIGQKAGIRFRSSYLDLHYTNNGQDLTRDRTRTDADVTFLANVTHSTSALLGVQIRNNAYDKNTQLDNLTYGVFTGFRLAPTRQFSGEFNIGYSIINYDRAVKEGTEGDDLIEQGLSRGSGQRTLLFMRGDLFWNPTPRLSISAHPFRYVRQSAVFNTGNFIATGINIYGRQGFTDRLAVRGSLIYENDKFDTERIDNRFSLRMGPEYRAVKWLGFRLDYMFEKRGSNQNDFDYYANTFMLSIQGVI